MEIDTEVKQIIEELQPIVEIAKLDGDIIVRNVGDDKKFPHFHWKNIHFELKSYECPKNVNELKEMIYFDSEKHKLSSKDLKDLLKILQNKSNKKAGKYFPDVYTFIISIWETLNEREIIS